MSFSITEAEAEWIIVQIQPSSRPAVSAAADWRALTQPQIRILTNLPKLPAGVSYLAPLLIRPGDEVLIQRDRSAVLGLCDLFPQPPPSR
jgi:hypothetical protein